MLFKNSITRVIYFVNSKKLYGLYLLLCLMHNDKTTRFRIIIPPCLFQMISVLVKTQKSRNKDDVIHQLPLNKSVCKLGLRCLEEQFPYAGTCFREICIIANYPCLSTVLPCSVHKGLTKQEFVW